eukprot:IDg7368t1
MGGDFVPWDPVCLSLAVRPEVLVDLYQSGSPMVLDDRGVRLTGRLDSYRRTTNGQAVYPGGWPGVSYRELKVRAPDARAPEGSSDGRRGCPGHEPTSNGARAALHREPDVPFVVIDLEAEVVVEEVGSDGKGLGPSGANRTRPFGKQEDIGVK